MRATFGSPVASVVAMIADGMTVDEILAEHPDLEADNVAESLRYAAPAVRRSSRCANQREVAGRPEPVVSARRPSRGVR